MKQREITKKISTCALGALLADIHAQCQPVKRLYVPPRIWQAIGGLSRLAITWHARLPTI